MTATDRTLTKSEWTARDVFNIWLTKANWIQTVYKEVTAFLGWPGKPTQDAHIEIARCLEIEILSHRL